MRRVTLFLLLLLAGPLTATDPAQAAGSSSLRLSVRTTDRDALVQRGVLRVRVRVARPGVITLKTSLAGLSRRSASVGRTVRLRRKGTHTVGIRLTRPARRSLGRCRAATLRVSARRKRARATAFLRLPACGTAPLRTVDGATGDWTGMSTFLAGESVLSRGELIYTDWLHDDYGPDLDGAFDPPAFRSNLAPARGDFTYAGDAARHGNNAADLREVRVAAAPDGGLRVLIGMQTMIVPDAGIVTLGIDTDGDPATSLPWPEGTGLTTKGPDRFVTTWGSGARLDMKDGSQPVKSAVDLAENAIELEVPASVLAGANDRARLWIVAGQHAGEGRWAPGRDGAPGVFNAGFRRETYTRIADSAWNDGVQAPALAARDIPEFTLPLPLGRLRAGESDPPPAVKPGYYNRIFRSANPLGEGVVLDANGGSEATRIGGGAEPTFRSPWQPYGLHVPKGYVEGRDHPLLLAGHSLDGNMNQYRVISPRLLEQLGDERGSLIVTPLARGTDTWYLDAGLVDTLEALADAERHYDTDAERTSLYGYSMGGYMSYRLGLLMPDRWARASSYVGAPVYTLWPYPGPIQSTPEWLVPGNTNQIVENAHNLPFEIVHGNADELVPVSGVQHQFDTFVARGNPVRFYRHSADDHFSFTLNDEWSRTRDFLGRFPRERDPARVVFRRMPVMDLPKHDLVFDRAYWIDGITLRDAAAPDAAGTVDVTSRRLGGTRRALERPAPAPIAGPTTPGTLSEQRVVPGAAIPRENAVELTLRNVGKLRLDLRRMGLELEGLKFIADTDGPVTVLVGKRSVTLPTGKSETTPVS